MSIFKIKPNSDRYSVQLVDNASKSSLLAPVSKSKRVSKNISRKVVSAFMALMIASVALLGTIGMAAPASAGNFIEDGFKSAFCGTGLFNYDLEQHILGPTTGDQNSPHPTPYEKYGTAGTTWTVWLGPERQQGLDGNGEFGGKTIVDFAGGKGNNGGIDSWGDGKADADKNTATHALPGFYNTKQTCAPMMEVGGTTVANLLLATTGEVVFITNTVYQVAYEAGSNILTSLAPTITKVVVALKDAIYFEFLTVMIMLSALWMAWVGLVKKASVQMAQGAIWMIGSAVAAVALMTNPLWLPTQVNTVVSSVSEAGMNAVTTATTAKGQTNICAVNLDETPPTSGDSYVAPKNTTTRNIIRQTQCTIWYSFLYTPWAIGQFGESPAAMSDPESAQKQSFNAAQGADGTVGGNKPLTDPGVQKVKMGNTIVDDSAQNWALFHLDNKVLQPKSNYGQQVNQQRALLNVASAQLHKDDPNLTYKGNGSSARIASASLTLIASIGAAIMIVIISMSMIVLDVGLVMLTLVSPVFFLAGVHPGFGRKVALGWLETIAGLAIKRIVLSLILSVMLVFYATVLADNANMPWIVSMILIIAVSIGGITYKDQIVGMFNKISFGGNGGMKMNESGAGNLGNVANKMGGLATGLIGGAVGGTVGKAAATVANNRSVNKTVKDRLNASGAGPSKNEKTTTSSQSLPDSTSSSSSSTSGSKPFSPTEHENEKAKNQTNGAGAGQEPHSKSTETTTPVPEDDGLTNSYSHVDEAPKTRADLRKEFKDEKAKVKDENFRNGVSNGPSIIGSAVMGGVKGFQSGAVKGTFSGAGVAKRKTENVLAENALLQQERDRQYASEQAKIERDYKKLETERKRAESTKKAEDKKKATPTTPNPRPTQSEKKESPKTSPTSKATEPKVQAPKSSSQGGLPPLTPRAEKGRVISLPNLGGNSTGERPSR